jgi:hypothetical protein
VNVVIDTLVIERSPGRRVDNLEPALRRELQLAGVPADRAGDVARAVLDEVLLKVER